ncbi:hypothetical protein DL98DRAFT_540044 [Cadophora sp. DSE1049]|nr:hypothetical protein DL98DRAFT_540044 [Cadophora sp. DSE1049]
MGPGQIPACTANMQTPRPEKKYIGASAEFIQYKGELIVYRPAWGEPPPFPGVAAPRFAVTQASQALKAGPAAQTIAAFQGDPGYESGAKSISGTSSQSSATDYSSMSSAPQYSQNLQPRPQSYQQTTTMTRAASFMPSQRQGSAERISTQ